MSLLLLLLLRTNEPLLPALACTEGPACLAGTVAVRLAAHSSAARTRAEEQGEESGVPSVDAVGPSSSRQHVRYVTSPVFTARRKVRASVACVGRDVGRQG